MKFERKLNSYNNDIMYAISNDNSFDSPENPEKGLHKAADFVLYLQTAKEDKKIGKFQFAPMPGCCGIVVSCYTFLNKEYRGTYLSDHFRALKDDLARHLGYSMMVATTQMNSIPAVKNMFKSKYVIPITFENKRTENLLGLGYKVLK